MKWLLRVALVFAVVGGLAASALAVEKELIGAGATFPYPLYSKMFDVYAKEYNVKVNYQAIGSGGGIRQLINKTVDFGASDAILTDEDTKAAGAPFSTSRPARGRSSSRTTSPIVRRSGSPPMSWPTSFWER